MKQQQVEKVEKAALALEALVAGDDLAERRHQPAVERRAALGERSHYRIPEGTFYVSRKNPN